MKQKSRYFPTEELLDELEQLREENEEVVRMADTNNGDYVLEKETEEWCEGCSVVMEAIKSSILGSDDE